MVQMGWVLPQRPTPQKKKMEKYATVNLRTNHILNLSLVPGVGPRERKKNEGNLKFEMSQKV